MTIQGMSFYDFVGKFIPGVLIWAPWLNKQSFTSGDSYNILHMIVAFVGFYLTGIIFNSLIFFLTKKLRRNPMMLVKARNDVGEEFKALNNNWHLIKYDMTNIETLYIKSYTFIQEKNMLGAIIVLESHEIFLKVIWPIVLYYIVYVILCGNFFMPVTVQATFIFLLICLIAIPVIWYKTQMKIYTSVWETELFIIETNKDKFLCEK